jgi:hypothetical protein
MRCARFIHTKATHVCILQLTRARGTELPPPPFFNFLFTFSSQALVVRNFPTPFLLAFCLTYLFSIRDCMVVGFKSSYAIRAYHH